MFARLSFWTANPCDLCAAYAWLDLKKSGSRRQGPKSNNGLTHPGCLARRQIVRIFSGKTFLPGKLSDGFFERLWKVREARCTSDDE
jgi:hypothetical protein